MPLNYKLIDDIEITGIDPKDYPDFSDAYISYATYDGRPMTDEELDLLNQDSDFVRQEIETVLY